MRLMKTAGAIVIGGLVLGCQGSGSGPKASAPAGATLSAADEQTAAELQRTYRASHPGRQVGYVNAVDPSRRILSVGGIPPDMVREGSIMSILTGGGGTVQAVVYAREAGYIQLRYQPLGPGQTGPATGELAVWNPGGPAVIPESIPPANGAPTGVTGTGTTGTGAATTGVTTTDVQTPPPPPPPATMPTDRLSPTTVPMTDLQPRLTSPPEAPTTPPATTETPPPPPPIAAPPTTMPATRPDLNK
jgi:hypothetical protein